jgi:hypothetical protein
MTARHQTVVPPAILIATSLSLRPSGPGTQPHIGMDDPPVGATISPVLAGGQTAERPVERDVPERRRPRAAADSVPQNGELIFQRRAATADRVSGVSGGKLLVHTIIAPGTTRRRSGAADGRPDAAQSTGWVETTGLAGQRQRQHTTARPSCCSTASHRYVLA